MDSKECAQQVKEECEEQNTTLPKLFSIPTRSSKAGTIACDKPSRNLPHKPIVKSASDSAILSRKEPGSLRKKSEKVSFEMDKTFPFDMKSVGTLPHANGNTHKVEGRRVTVDNGCRSSGHVPNKSHSRRSFDLSGLYRSKELKSTESITESTTLDPTKPDKLSEVINAEIICFTARPSTISKPNMSESYNAIKGIANASTEGTNNYDEKNSSDTLNFSTALSMSPEPCKKIPQKTSIRRRKVNNVAGTSRECSTYDKEVKREALENIREVVLSNEKIDHIDRTISIPVSPKTKQLLLRREAINNIIDYERPKHFTHSSLVNIDDIESNSTKGKGNKSRHYLSPQSPIQRSSSAGCMFSLHNNNDSHDRHGRKISR